MDNNNKDLTKHIESISFKANKASKLLSSASSTNKNKALKLILNNSTNQHILQAITE